MRSKSAAPKYQRSYNAHWEYDPQEDHPEPHHAPQMTPEAPPPKALHVHVSEVWRECMESIQLEYHAYCNRVAKRLRDEARHRREAEEARSYNMPPIMRGCIESIVESSLQWSARRGEAFRPVAGHTRILQFLDR
jgi:hypothetical protein